MIYRRFGRTELSVSAIGFGGGHIGEDFRTEEDVANLLNTALDSGINLIDTARGYGKSEDRIGKHLSHRREDFILSTKIGYGIDGIPDWSPEIISAGIAEALRLCRTDRIDIVHLHSCPVETLQYEDMLNALVNEKEKGTVRYIAYSGENEPLDYAVGLNVFDSIQCSVNIADQQSVQRVFPKTIEKGMGVIAKRPVANMAWRFSERPAGEYAEVYWDRLQQMNLNTAGMDWMELALRFTISVPGVHSCIVGTGNTEHLKRNAKLAEKGELPDEIYQANRNRFLEVGSGWQGEV